MEGENNHRDTISLTQRFPRRASQWKLRTRTLCFGQRPLLMGIVNVTPDSFSDRGKFFSADSAIQQGLQLVEQGADLLDIGGESTRPYSTSVAADEELRRVIPVVEALCRQVSTPVSIDTSKAVVAEAAMAVGAEIINDVTALEGDPRMIDVVVQSEAAVCVMHMQGTPQTMQDGPCYRDVVEEIYDYLKIRRDKLIDAGVSPEKICLDPGIGFGKTHQHNLTLLAHTGRFHELGCPLLVGHSRKGFLGKVLGDSEADRDAASIGVSLAQARQGIQILRIHQIEPTHQAMLLFEATGGIDGREIEL